MGCSYDWTIGSGPTGTEAGADAATDTTLDSPTGGDSPAIDAPIDASSDEAGPPNCTVLASDLQQAHAQAILCTPQVGACETPVTDECNCTVYVGNGSSTATTNYRLALQNFETASCTPSCPGCGSPQPGLCITSDGGSTFCAQ